MDTPTSNTALSKKTLFIVGVLIVAAVAVFAFWLLLFQDTKENSVSHLPATRFLVEDEGGAWYRVQEETADGITSVIPEFDGEVVDYIREGEVEALIRSVEDAYYVLYREAGGEWQTVSDTAIEKAALSISADGEALAYAERVDIEKSPLDILGWEVRVFVRETEDLISVGPGFAPYFLPLPDGEEDWEGIFFSTPYGVGMFDFIQDSVEYFDVVSTSSTEFPIVFAKDGTHLAVYSPRTDMQTIFSIEQRSPLQVSMIGSVPPLRDGLFVGTKLQGIPKEDSRFLLFDVVKGEEEFVGQPKVEAANVINSIE